MIKKRIIGCLLTSILLLFPVSFSPGFETPAYASERVSYLDEDGVRKEADVFVLEEGQYAGSPDFLVEQDYVLPSGWYSVRGFLWMNDRIQISGDVHLILEDGSDFDINDGINVSAGNTLTIYAQSAGEAMGELMAYSWRGDAGIGGGDGEDCGAIIINGGNIDSTANLSGAGIGGGMNGDGGSITINGGKVSAKSGHHGAGLGGGKEGDGGLVKITGGIVSAIGGSQGSAGIGGGGTGRTTGGSGGRTVISGGNVYAKGRDGGAGIGAGIANADQGYFSTGVNGNAYIVAVSEDSDVPDIGCQTEKSNWRGIVFEDRKGALYGDTVQLTADITVTPSLTIIQGQTLIVPSGVTLTVERNAIDNQGTIMCNGQIFGDVLGNPPGGWIREGNTWYYRDLETGERLSDGLHIIGGKTYYFYDWGGMANDWWLETEDGGWYFFDGSGAMKISSWVQWKGLWYYLTDSGRMAVNTTTPDGYYVNANGVWVK